MNAFITGGAGFVGWHLCDLMLGEGHSVTCYDILDPLVVNPDLGRVGMHPRFTLVNGDILDLDTLCTTMAGHELVIHAAAQSAVDRSIRDPVSTFRMNALGTVNILEAVRHSGIARVHYVSTDEVFGASNSGSFTEGSPWRPRNPYSAGKAAGEAAILAWGNTYGLAVTVTNGTNNYGERQSLDKVIPRMVVRALLGKTLPVYGDGRQMREWLHVTDHCRAIWHVIQHGLPGQSYCVGGGLIAENIEIVRRLLDILGLDDSRIEFVADRPGHDRRYAVDTSKLRQLGWAPGVPFEQGLRDTVAWYRENRQWWEFFLDENSSNI